MLPRLHALEPLIFGRFVAFQLVGHAHPRRQALLLQALTEQPLGYFWVSMSLHQNSEHVACGLHRSPPVIVLSFDGDHDCIESPLIRKIEAFAAHWMRLLLPQVLAPCPNGLVSHLEPPLQQQLLDVPVAQRKGVIKSDTVTDHCGGQAVAGVHGRTRPARRDSVSYLLLQVKLTILTHGSSMAIVMGSHMSKNAPEAFPLLPLAIDGMTSSSLNFASTQWLTSRGSPPAPRAYSLA